MKVLSFFIVSMISGSALAGYKCSNSKGGSLKVSFDRALSANVIYKVEGQAHELNGHYKMTGDALYKAFEFKLTDESAQEASLKITEQTILSGPTRGGVCTRRFCPVLDQVDQTMI